MVFPQLDSNPKHQRILFLVRGCGVGGIGWGDFPEIGRALSPWPGPEQQQGPSPNTINKYLCTLSMLLARSKDRVKILGKAMPTSYGLDDKVDSFRVQRGVPINWHETKSVALWYRILKDIPGLTHVLDFGVGSAAAAIASWKHDLKYEGVCVNKFQKDWLDNQMDTSMFAVVAQGFQSQAQQTDKDFQTKVKHLFAPQVQEGMRMICYKKEEAQKEKKEPTPAGGGQPTPAGGGHLDDDDI